MDRVALLESQLKDVYYHPAEPNKNGSHIAENTQTPYPMVKAFYELGSGTYPENQDGFYLPPDQNRYTEQMYAICQKYAEGEHRKKFRDRYKQGWTQRFRRSWTSFVREMHFSYLSSKLSIFETQKYTIRDDIDNKADLICEYDKTAFSINLFIDTKRSRDHLAKKIDTSNNNILVPLNPNGYKQKVQTQNTDIWTYSDRHILAINHLIREGQNSVTLDDNITTVEIVDS